MLVQGGVRLTPTMLSVDGANYPVASIASFRTTRWQEEITAWWVVLALTGFVAFVSALGSLGSLLDGDFGGFLGGALWSAAVGGVAYYCWLCTRPERRKGHHNLILTTAGGDVQALSSPLQADVQRVAQALSEVIAQRG